MGKFEYEWWTVKVREATGMIGWEIKAKNKENAIKKIKKWAKEQDEEVQRVRPEFHTEIFWETLTLDRKGYGGDKCNEKERQCVNMDRNNLDVCFNFWNCFWLWMSACRVWR